MSALPELDPDLECLLDDIEKAAISGAGDIDLGNLGNDGASGNFGWIVDRISRYRVERTAKELDR